MNLRVLAVQRVIEAGGDAGAIGMKLNYGLFRLKGHGVLSAAVKAVWCSPPLSRRAYYLPRWWQRLI